MPNENAVAKIGRVSLFCRQGHWGGPFAPFLFSKRVPRPAGGSSV